MPGSHPKSTALRKSPHPWSCYSGTVASPTCSEAVERRTHGWTFSNRRLDKPHHSRETIWELKIQNQGLGFADKHTTQGGGNDVIDISGPLISRHDCPWSAIIFMPCGKTYAFPHERTNSPGNGCLPSSDDELTTAEYLWLPAGST